MSNRKYKCRQCLAFLAQILECLCDFKSGNGQFFSFTLHFSMLDIFFLVYYRIKWMESDKCGEKIVYKQNRVYTFRLINSLERAFRWLAKPSTFIILLSAQRVSFFPLCFSCFFCTCSSFDMNIQFSTKKKNTDKCSIFYL